MIQISQPLEEKLKAAADARGTTPEALLAELLQALPDAAPPAGGSPHKIAQYTLEQIEAMTPEQAFEAFVGSVSLHNPDETYSREELYKDR